MLFQRFEVGCRWLCQCFLLVQSHAALAEPVAPNPSKILGIGPPGSGASPVPDSARRPPNGHCSPSRRTTPSAFRSGRFFIKTDRIRCWTVWNLLLRELAPARYDCSAARRPHDPVNLSEINPIAISTTAQHIYHDRYVFRPGIDTVRVCPPRVPACSAPPPRGLTQQFLSEF